MNVHLMHMKAAGEVVLVAIDRAGGTSRSFSPLVDSQTLNDSGSCRPESVQTEIGTLPIILTGRTSSFIGPSARLVS